MKILELCAIDQTMKVFLKPLTKELIYRGFEVVGVCSKGLYTEELKKDGIHIINIPIERKIRFFSNIQSIYRLYKILKTERPDVLHVHTPVASILGRIAGKFARVPIIIYTAHGFYFHENINPIKYRLFLNIEKYTARFFTDFIFTQSKEDASTAIQKGFADKERILCIGNGVDVISKFNPKNVDIEHVDRINSEFCFTDENIIITFIGRLVREKGIVELLEAFSTIDNDSVRLLIVGDIDQGCRDNSTKNFILNKYKPNKNVIFTGFREDIHNILYRTDIFCLPSYREGMPRTIIEAMAMNCAVIATDIRGCREEVIDGETGFLVKLQSANDIKDKLITLVDNTELLNEMKIEGRIRAEEIYNEMHVLNQQIKVIKQLLNQKNCK